MKPGLVLEYEDDLINTVLEELITAELMSQAAYALLANQEMVEESSEHFLRAAMLNVQWNSVPWCTTTWNMKFLTTSRQPGQQCLQSTWQRGCFATTSSLPQQSH